MGLTFSFDLGIASVGWAVINDEYEILESCSNIFSSAEPSQNVTRRDNREIRRNIRRKKTRISDFKKMWKSFNLTIPDGEMNDVLELRIKGLAQKLSEDEIFFVLLNNLKHRGISYLEDAESGNTSSEYSKSILLNTDALKEKLPCEIQLERLQKYGAYRGNISAIIEDEPIVLRNVFTVSAYQKEIETFLETQKSFNSKISDDFKEAFITIFRRKRAYYEGPGNELSRTDYGKYTTKIDPETGKYITEENIFEKLIGTCSILKDRRRAAGASYTAQEFNVLNDLNNLTVEDRKLTKEEKEAIINTIKTSKTVNVRKIIAATVGVKEKDLSLTGARIDKNDKEIFHSFEAYNKMRKALAEIDFDINDLSREDLDTIGEILTLNTDKEAILNEFNRNGLFLTDEVKDCLISVRKNNGTLFTKWQSFCTEIMLELIPEMYEEPKNQMQILSERGLFKSRVEQYKDCTKIPSESITDEIYNPVVAKTVRITVRIINALIDKYGNPDTVVIEMPRDRNSDEEKDRIKKTQALNEKELPDIIKKIKTDYNIEITDKDFKEHSKLGLKLKLWNEQQGKCPYSGKKIEIRDILDNPSLFEVDHIIPLSISFDDSRNNKVLVYAIENQEKGQQTPVAYLSSVNRDWDVHEFMSYVLTTYKGKEKSKKKANLLFSEDITKIDVLKGFINRNINDTRYASRTVLNLLQDYFKAKETGTKVKVIRGSFTAQMRANLKITKDREESYVHHAIDATLIGYSQMGYDAYRKITEEYIDFEAEEYKDKQSFDKLLKNDLIYKEALYQSKWMKIKSNIENAAKTNKYWYQVDKKCNRQLSDATIYGTRDIDGKTCKISKFDIRSKDAKKKFASNKDKLLMKRNDPQTFNILVDIFNNYADADNPFVQYEKETGKTIQKYSKKGNGPKITNLKYENGEVNSCIDISHKYGFEKGSKKVILDSLNPYRMDVYYNATKNDYIFVGIKYADIKCKGDKFIINEERYVQSLINEKILSEGQTLNDLEATGYEFKLSFYRDDIIRYEKDGEIFTERFLSRTMPKVKNYIETKPIDAPKFNKQHLVGLSKTNKVEKLVSDILGNKYLIKQEKFKTIVG